MRSMLVALVFVLSLVGCDDVQVGVVDEGFMVVDDGRGGELSLHPGALPLTVGWDDSYIDPGIEAAYMDGVARVNGLLGVEAFVLADEVSAPAVTIETGYIPEGTDGYWADWTGGGQEELERTQVFFAESGAIVGATIIVNVDYAYDHDLMVVVVAHGCGHVLGLADDPGIDVTVELQSLMSEPLDPLGRFTESDRALLSPYLEGLPVY